MLGMRGPSGPIKDAAGRDAMAAPTLGGVMEITMNMDVDQLEILLGRVERSFNTSRTERSVELLAEEIETAEKLWDRPGDDRSFIFENVKIAPVYAQLLASWKQAGGTGPVGGILEPTLNCEMGNALSAARAAVAGEQG